ncbi:MAG: hypothetical protein JWM62_1534 [Frankiales bacterium]|nr:hypothetical protein [Frankiales bacterium]
MKIAARRRLAVSVLAATSVVAGLAVLPAVYAAESGLQVDPSAAFNSNPAQVLTFESTSGDTDLRYGGTATFSLLSRPSATFTVDIAGSDLPVAELNESTGEVDLTDPSDGAGTGVGKDGPADAGTYRVSIAGAESSLPPAPGGGGTDACASCFVVLPQADLRVTSVAPTSLRPNNSANVSILGSGFTRSTTVEFLQNGARDTLVNATAPPTDADGAAVEEGITTNSELRRRLVVTTGAAEGPRDVRVTNPDGTTHTCLGCFTVAGAALTGINPPGGDNAPTTNNVTVTVTGTNITNGELSLEFLDTPGSATRSALTIPATGETRAADGRTLTGVVNLSNAAPGRYQPVVRNTTTGIVNACDTCIFTVAQNRSITVTAVDATGTATGSSQPAGTTRTFDITGTNFSKGAAVTVSGTGVTTTLVEFVSPTQLRATFQSTSAAATGARNVVVTLTDGKTATCSGCYTVTAGASASPSATPTSSISPSPSASGNPSTFSFTRLAGTERYATAARIATTSAATATTVILANGQSDDPRTSRNENHFPDALAAAYLAGNRSAPTLLTAENDLPTATEDALEAIDPDNVVIVGGTAAVSTAVQRELQTAGYTVTRIAGATRYDTASAVAAEPGTNYVGTSPEGDRTAIVASGQDFPDALVAGPVSYRAKFPVLVTTTAGLSSQTRKSLQDLQIGRVLITGGTAAVSTKVEQDIQAMGIDTQRLAGTNRAATAVAVAAYAYDQLGFDRSHVNLARGDQFADALAGGPHGGREGAPILLTLTARTVGTATLDFLQARGGALRAGHIFGGTGAVTQEAEDEAEAAARRGRGGASPSASASASARPSGSASATTSPRPSGSATPAASSSPMCIPDTELCNPL